MARRVLLVLLVLVVAVLAWAGFNYRRANLETSTLNDDVRKAAGGSYVKLADGVVHYQLAGLDTGRAVVLVHGFSVPYYIWDPVFDTLTRAGFRVLRYDLFGRG